MLSHMFDKPTEFYAAASAERVKSAAFASDLKFINIPDTAEVKNPKNTILCSFESVL